MYMKSSQTLTDSSATHISTVTAELVNHNTYYSSTSSISNFFNPLNTSNTGDSISMSLSSLKQQCSWQA